MPMIHEKQVFKFTDDVMFKRVMHNEDICKGVIERAIGRPVGKIAYSNTEQELGTGPRKKVIRADSYLVESQGHLFDVEMQVKHTPVLPLRFRAYQSIMDGSVLWRGSDYDQLVESYIIFICTYDPFGQGLPVYTVERRCLEDSQVDFDCRAHWKALNSTAYDSLEEGSSLRSLLRYVQTGKASKDDELVEDIAQEVARNNNDEAWVSEMLSSLEIAAQEARIQARYEEREKGRNEGREEGRAEGREEGRKEGREEGREQGREEGRAEGREEGRAEGESRFAKLVSVLMENGRIDDVRLASSNEQVREKLYTEFDL